MATEYAIETHHLVKKYGEFAAVNGLSLRIGKGELFGFLGPNGAGKTTTIRMLTTLTRPTEGNAKVAGFDIVADGDKVRARIGVVPQSFSLFEELTPAENLNFIGELYGMEKAEIREKTEELLKTAGLWEKKDLVCAGFSGGMKQRLSVAASLLHTPEILFMDEPTTGLDPQSRIALRELTQKLNESGITVVYTTHDMEEADKLCDRIAIMDKGKVIAQGTSEQLKNEHGSGHLIRVELESRVEGIESELNKLARNSKITYRGNVIEVHTKSIAQGLVYKISSLLSKKKAKVRDLRVSEPSLEEVFINLTRKEFRD